MKLLIPLLLFALPCLADIEINEEIIRLNGHFENFYGSFDGPGVRKDLICTKSNHKESRPANATETEELATHGPIDFIQFAPNMGWKLSYTRQNAQATITGVSGALKVIMIYQFNPLETQLIGYRHQLIDTYVAEDYVWTGLECGTVH